MDPMGDQNPSSDQSGNYSRRITLPDPVGVRELATALKLKPYVVIGSLMELNVFASINGTVSFDTAFALCARHGIIAMKSDPGWN